MAKVLKILVLHGYVQTAETVYANTAPLRAALEASRKCSLTYVRGVPPPGRTQESMGSRPWWIMTRQVDGPLFEGFEDSIKFFADLLSKEQYDGVIGLSQGAAMAALLTSLISNPKLHPAFKLSRPHPPFKFGIFCSGFASDHEQLQPWYQQFPADVPTVHTISRRDGIVNPAETVRLSEYATKKLVEWHDFGHVIPISADFTALFADFIGAFHEQASQDKEEYFDRII